MSARFINPLQVLNVKGVVSPKGAAPAPLRLTNVGTEDAEIRFSRYGGLNVNILARVNGVGGWQVLSSVVIAPNSYVEYKSDGVATSIIGSFAMSQSKIAASGSVMSLIYGDTLNAENNKVIPFDRAFDSTFAGCTSLTAAPELPATTLAAYCYEGTFHGCTSLTTAPELPATTLAVGCYQNTFAGCTSLTAAPELPATTLAAYCYVGTFHGCISLTAAPELPATTLVESCYYGIFLGCTNLTAISVKFTNWDEENNATGDWLANVAATGTFTCPAGLDTTTRNGSHVPAGWTIETY